jgi:hypothetical protein
MVMSIFEGQKDHDQFTKDRLKKISNTLTAVKFKGARDARLSLTMVVYVPVYDNQVMVLYHVSATISNNSIDRSTKHD